jgi:hypothetical protein
LPPGTIVFVGAPTSAAEVTQSQSEDTIGSVIEQVFVRDDRPIWELVLQGTDDAMDTHRVTDSHPYWVPESGWVEVGQLAVGMDVATAAGETARVVGLRNTGRVERTYNLAVANFHTYVVGSHGTVVHNCNIEINGSGGAARTEGHIDKVREAVRDALTSANSKADLLCAQCKLKKSIKNRKAEQRRRGPEPRHQARIRQEADLLNTVEKRLRELDDI